MMPIASGPTPWPKQVAVNRMIADARARMLGRATVSAMAKIGPRCQRLLEQFSKDEVAVLLGHIDRLTDTAAKMLDAEKDLS